VKTGCHAQTSDIFVKKENEFRNVSSMEKWLESAAFFPKSPTF